MASVSQALSELNITEWVLRGEPTTEAEFNSMFRKVTGADSNGSAIESANQSDWGVTWSQVSAKTAELTAAEPMKALREERDRRLAEVDWVTLKAYSQGVAVPTEYATYQQALRDVPASATSLDDVTWPTKP
jgi:hypothetical protein